MNAKPLITMPTIPTHREKRKFYRLQFPPDKRPQLLINEHSHAVADCSAHGVRYIASSGDLPTLGDHVQGLLHFRHGAQTPVLGVVLRITGDEVVLHIPDREIPSSILRSEERHLLKTSSEDEEPVRMPARVLAPVLPDSSAAAHVAEGKERREFYRIHYPITARPSLFLEESKAFLIVDISARGLRYAAPNTLAPNLHQFVKGILHFRRGPQLNIEGTVIRAQNDEVALYLHQEIPSNILLAEQRQLRKNYPMWPL
ncbi:MAG: PilZ domain-containing protein [Candidatus Competibacteraceae bacterium]|nr:PilZ domain-containing protein [Candidatus Competibacteraceae bacterium]